MDKESFKKQLKKYNFSFVDFNNIVTIRLEHSLEVDVDFNLFEKILISDRLNKGNFLTGIFPIKIKHIAVYNILILLTAAIIFIYESRHFNSFPLLMSYILVTGWVLLWNSYYNTKSESIKSTFMVWLEGK
ncbi:MAG TPA: hypothetical protein VE870_15800 [Bacteroidales bacterium]|nr:hypothetical protein [Bacteroidales bacterium]